jgi:hypothetical protein
MDTSQEETMPKYPPVLKTKVSHISALSAEQRAALLRESPELVDEVKSALEEDPAGPNAPTPLRFARCRSSATHPGLVERNGCRQMPKVSDCIAVERTRVQYAQHRRISVPGTSSVWA